MKRRNLYIGALYIVYFVFKNISKIYDNDHSKVMDIKILLIRKLILPYEVFTIWIWYCDKCIDNNNRLITCTTYYVQQTYF